METAPVGVAPMGRGLFCLGYAQIVTLRTISGDPLRRLNRKRKQTQACFHPPHSENGSPAPNRPLTNSPRPPVGAVRSAKNERLPAKDLFLRAPPVRPHYAQIALFSASIAPFHQPAQTKATQSPDCQKKKGCNPARGYNPFVNGEYSILKTEPFLRRQPW